MWFTGDMNNTDTLPTLPNRDKLVAQPTLCQGWDSDLKFDDGRVRIWLSRVFDDQAEVEVYDGSCWCDAGTYNPYQPPRHVAGYGASLHVGDINPEWMS
jgi:hypothetical protein